MNELGKAAGYSLETMKTAGFNHCECRLTNSEKHEVTLNCGEIDLLRTTADISMELTGIRSGVKTEAAISSEDLAEVNNAVAGMEKRSRTSTPDPANMIAPYSEPGEWSSGPSKPDIPLMIERLEEFRDYTSRRYPSLLMRRCILQHMKFHRRYVNSNGTDLSSVRGIYSFSPIFTAKTDGKQSSFNYINAYFASLDSPLHTLSRVEEMMGQSTEQIDSRNFPGSFTGDIIVTPECLDYFVYLITMHLQDYYLIRQSSLFMNRIGKKVADSRFTLRSTPVSDEIPYGYFITLDGYPAVNTIPINRGKLESCLLSHYGAAKTGLPRGLNQGGVYCIDPGDTPVGEMISSVRKGLLLNRFSGGMPDARGNFSGLAKNSYYIENGAVKYPVKDVMIKANLLEMLSGIKSISGKRVYLRHSLLPWIQFRDVFISGS